jgi:internalin A
MDKKELEKVTGKSWEELRKKTILLVVDIDLTELPEMIGELTELIALYLWNNKLKRLPETIGRLKNLYSLNVKSNNLKELPETIGELKGLTELYLYNNNLKRLPETIGELKNLTVVDLSWNENLDFDDTFKKLLTLENLTSLNLCGTKLYKLPKSIKKLAITLKTLDLKYNPILNNLQEMEKVKFLLPNTVIKY